MFHQNIVRLFAAIARKINIILENMTYLVNTGGGKLMYRITKPAEIRNTSRKIIIPLSHIGNRLQHVSDITRDPTSNLSAIGSKNDPSLLACDTQLRAIKPSN